MKEKRVNIIYRDKFLADLECEFCSYVEEDAFGEDSHEWYFSELPRLKCPNCYKSTKGEEKYEIKESGSVFGFLCIKYRGFREMYMWWGGEWCLEVFLTRVKELDELFALECAGKIRDKFNKHFQENNVDGSLYFSVSDWDDLVESVISEGE